MYLRPAFARYSFGAPCAWIVFVLLSPVSATSGKATFSHGGPLVWVLLMLSLQGCAVDIAKLPESSFSASSGTSSSGTRSLSASPIEKASLTPKANQTQRGHAAVSTPGTQTGAPFTSGSVQPQHANLANDTDRLLERYGYVPQPDESANTNRFSIGARQPQIPATPLQTRQPAIHHANGGYRVQAVDAPLHGLLFAIADDANLQLEIHGQLDTRVTINALDSSIDQILSLLAAQGDFAWQLNARHLTIWAGEPFSKSYAINYLNMQRRTQSSVGLATQVGTINATGGAGSGSIANSSQTLIENSSDHHFWDSLLADINGIVRTSGADSQSGAQMSINRDAGLLTLYATPDIHRDVQRYLNIMAENSQRQVLIEATVVEVALSDSFDAGVDWQVLANGVSGISAAQILVGAPTVSADTVDRLSEPAGLISLVQQGSNADVRTTLSLLEQFGDVRILSRPRIIALNNQSSVLKVVDNRVYFTLNVQRLQNEDRDEIVTATEIHTVPVGLVMNVTPQISATGMVMLNVRPTLSRILGFVNDPNPELALANVSNGVPEIQVREMESMLQVQSGKMAIIGGLMQETDSDNDSRLPGLGALPGIGKLFSRKTRERRQTELLIVLRPTVLDRNQPGAQW